MSHGTALSLTLDGGGTSGKALLETGDNSTVLENLRDQYNLLNNRLLPLVRKWSVILTKAGSDNCDSDTLKRVIDLKLILEEGESWQVSSKEKRAAKVKKYAKLTGITKYLDLISRLKTYPYIYFSFIFQMRLRLLIS